MASQAAYRLLFYRTGSSGKPELPESLFLRQLGELLNCEALPDKLNCLIRMVNAAELPGKLFGELFESAGCFPGGTVGDDTHFFAGSVFEKSSGKVAVEDPELFAPDV